MSIRVVLAEDNALLRQGVSSLIEREDDIHVVATAGDRASLERLIETHQPDVVVTDIRMPPHQTDEGIQVAAWLREERPSVGVVVLSQYAEPVYALALLQHGSAGRAYLLKERVAEVDEVVTAIRAVHQGKSVIDSAVFDAMVLANTRRKDSPLDRLSAREQEVLSHIAEGWDNAKIAATLILSKGSVEKHTNSIFAKLGLTEEPDVNRRVKAVLLYLHAGLKL